MKKKMISYKMMEILSLISHQALIYTSLSCKEGKTSEINKKKELKRNKRKERSEKSLLEESKYKYIYNSVTLMKRGAPHLSRLSLCASILQSLPRVCGASRLPHSFCRMDSGIRKAFGPTSVVMLLAGSRRDVSMHWESCTHRLYISET